MRFNKRVTFYKHQESYYDPSKGEYVETEPIKKTKPCNKSHLSIDRQVELFGKIDVNVAVIRLQQPYNNDFDYAVLDGQKFELIKRSDHLKGIFFMRGVVKDG